MPRYSIGFNLEIEADNEKKAAQQFANALLEVLEGNWDDGNADVAPANTATPPRPVPIPPILHDNNKAVVPIDIHPMSDDDRPKVRELLANGPQVDATRIEDPNDFYQDAWEELLDAARETEASRES